VCNISTYNKHSQANGSIMQNYVHTRCIFPHNVNNLCMYFKHLRASKWHKHAETCHPSCIKWWEYTLHDCDFTYFHNLCDHMYNKINVIVSEHMKLLTGLCWLRLPAAGSHGLFSKLLRFSALAGPVLLAKVETAIILSTNVGTLAFKDWNKITLWQKFFLSTHLIIIKYEGVYCDQWPLLYQVYRKYVLVNAHVTKKLSSHLDKYNNYIPKDILTH
jgi:hypothetical protein